MRQRLLALTVASAAFLLSTAPAIASSFPATIELDPGWRPEGITAGRDGTAYVGSLANGAVAEVDLFAGTVDVLVPGVTGSVAVGLDYEAGAHRLWVAGGPGPTSQVRAYDASTGSLLETYSFTAGFLNDVAVTRDAVYVTDSGIQQLIVIPLGNDGSLPEPADAFTLPITGDFVYQTGFNANGIVEFAGWLIVPQSNTGQLFAIDPDTGRSVEILDEGSVNAADGLELVGSTLYVVQNSLNQVAVFRILGGTVQSLGTITDDGLDVPTTIAFAGGSLWAVNARFTTPPTPDTEYWITQLPTR